MKMHKNRQFRQDQMGQDKSKRDTILEIKKLSRKFATNSSRTCPGRLLVVARGSEPWPLRGSGYKPRDARSHEAVRRVSRKKHLAQTRSRVAPNDDGASQFRSHIARLYLKNTFNAHQVQQLLEKSEAAGAQGVADVASASKRGSIPKNTSRDLMRKLLKSVTAPPVYWADVPLHETKGSTTTCRLPVLLPHEMFASIMARDSNLSRFEDQRLQHLLQLPTDFCNAMRLAEREAAIIGVHGDGVPHQRVKSVECFFVELRRAPRV